MACSHFAVLDWGASRHAQVPRKMIGTDGFQETPIVEVTRQITKHNYLVMDVNDIPRVLKEVRHVMAAVLLLAAHAPHFLTGCHVQCTMLHWSMLLTASSCHLPCWIPCQLLPSI